MKFHRGEQSGLISVIVPVYNAQRHLPRCLESIGRQTYPNIEAILVNDGSTDNSGSICEFYARNDKRIHVVHTENLGPAAARNTGIQRANGEFIFFIDADDHLELNAFAELIAAYQQNKADIVVADFKRVRQDQSKISCGDAFPDDRILVNEDIISYVRTYLKKPNRHPLFTYSWGRLFKVSIIKENGILFDENLHTFEDVAFNFVFLKHTEKILFLKKCLYNHLVHDNYASASLKIGANPESLFGYRAAMAKAREFLLGCGLEADDVQRAVGHAYTCYTIIQLIRMCGQLNDENRTAIYAFVKNLVNEGPLADSVRFYAPSKGDSRILPILFKLKCVRTILMVCRYKAQQRYRRK